MHISGCFRFRCLVAAHSVRKSYIAGKLKALLFDFLTTEKQYQISFLFSFLYLLLNNNLKMKLKIQKQKSTRIVSVSFLFGLHFCHFYTLKNCFVINIDSHRFFSLISEALCFCVYLFIYLFL